MSRKSGRLDAVLINCSKIVCYQKNKSLSCITVATWHSPDLNISISLFGAKKKTSNGGEMMCSADQENQTRLHQIDTSLFSPSPPTFKVLLINEWPKDCQRKI